MPEYRSTPLLRQAELRNPSLAARSYQIVKMNQNDATMIYKVQFAII
jgi:hypothetical protein